jgi:hypothetical protein
MAPEHPELSCWVCLPCLSVWRVAAILWTQDMWEPQARFSLMELLVALGCCCGGWCCRLTANRAPEQHRTWGGTQQMGTEVRAVAPRLSSQASWSELMTSASASRSFIRL